MRTQQQHQESSFNSKELSKILPSYLLYEIDNEEKKEEKLKDEKGSFNIPILKESNMVRKQYFNLKKIYYYFLFI